MARFLVATTAFPAHLDWGGLLSTAQHLYADGHDVLWLTGSALTERLQREGAQVRSIPTVDPHRDGKHREFLGPDADRRVIVDTWRAAFHAPRDPAIPFPRRLVPSYTFLIRLLTESWLYEEAMANCCDAIAAIIKEWLPDVLIAEPFMLPAALAAEAAGVPLASCGYPGPLLTLQPLPEVAKVARQVHDTLTRLRRRLHLSTLPPRPDVDLFFAAPNLQIVFFPPDWYGDLSGPVSPGVQFVGSTSMVNGGEPENDGATGQRPLVVMAVASSYLPDPRVLRAMFDGVGRVDGSGVIGGCPELRPLFEPLPRHIRWERWVCYDEVLPNAAAIVHHGGLGTTHAAVHAATPQLVLPGPIDQCLHAEAVARAGAGLMHVGPLTAEALGGRLRELLSSAQYRRSALRLREHFGRFGGVSRAAALLVDLARTHHPSKAN